MKFFRPLLILTALALILTGPLRAESQNRMAAGIMVGDPSGITLKFGQFPVLAFGWSGIHSRLHLNLDYWIINRVLEEPFYWYLGVGGKIWIWGNRNAAGTDSFALGARVPVGLQWFFADDWELFLEAAPGIAVIPVGFWWDAGLGLRYYF